MRGSHAVAGLLVAVGVVTLVLATWLDAAVGPPHAHGLADVAWTWASVLAVAVLGLRVVQHRPRHVVGWIMVVMACVGGLTTFAEQWAYAGLVWRPGRYPAAAFADVASMASWLTAFAGIAFLVLYFPDGRLPSRRWRAFPVVMGVSFAGAWAGATVQPGRQGDPFTGVENPAGIAWFGGAGEVVVGAFMLAALACLALSAVSVVMRFRRSSGQERAQIAWLVYAVLLLPVALLGCVIGLAATGTDVVGEVALPLVLVLVPTAIGLAVLRYRLYDVEYLINRTIVYALVTVAVSGTFAITALLAGVAIGHGSSWVVAVATLGAVLVARTARSTAQRWVNRRFDRAVTDSVAIVDAFLAALRDDTSDPALVETTLARALHDASLAVRLWLPRSAVLTDVHGHVAEQPAGSHRRSVTRVTKGDMLLAEIDHDSALLAQPRLLRAVVQRSRLALELARLAAESASQVAEVEASRARIVEASYAERRRLERDLHDGAQQRLVALGVRIRRLQRSMPPSSQILSPALDQTVDEISATIHDLRRLAAGVRPARLDDGLAPALEDLARSTPVPVELRVETGRAPESVEMSAYFVACEGVTNAVKHAQASRIIVDARRDQGVLRVRVVDDGIGGATARPASGLAGLADRVAALGGRLALTSAVGRGTTLEADLPCAP